VNGIRETKMPQRVGNQQVSEFVVQIRGGNRMAREQYQAKRHWQNSQRQHAPTGSAREPRTSRFYPRARSQSQDQQQRGYAELDEIARAKADRVAHGQERPEKIGQEHEISLSPC
jgi:hypothetical protein